MGVRIECVIPDFRINLLPYSVSINPASAHKLLRVLDNLGLDILAEEEDLSSSAFIMQLKLPARKPRLVQ